MKQSYKRIGCLLLILSNPNLFADVFSWPAGLTNKGPYTLASGISNSIVFAPNSNWATEADVSSHKYHHHTRIAWIDGLTVIAFSSAATNEQDCGMETVVAFSTNNGRTWSDPVVACPPQSEWKAIHWGVPSRITYPRNFQTNNGFLYLITGIDELQTYSSGTKTQVVGVALSANKINWNGTSASVGLPFRISSADYPAMDGKDIINYDPVLGPNLMAYSKIFGTWGGSYPTFTNAEWAGWLKTNGVTFVEPNTFQSNHSGSILFRIWRCTDLGQTTNVYQQVSSDGGETWPSAPIATTIPNAPSETTGILLNDGRYAFLGNPVDTSTIRDPLFLALTDVGSPVITNVYAVRQGLSGTPTYSGWSKYGGASYVHAIQVGNYLYVSYSMQKESIGFSRVLIPGLPDNNNDVWNPRVTLGISTIRSSNMRSQ